MHRQTDRQPRLAWHQMPAQVRSPFPPLRSNCLKLPYLPTGWLGVTGDQPCMPKLALTHSPAVTVTFPTTEPCPVGRTTNTWQQRPHRERAEHDFLFPPCPYPHSRGQKREELATEEGRKEGTGDFLPITYRRQAWAWVSLSTLWSVPLRPLYLFVPLKGKGQKRVRLIQALDGCS